MASFDHDVVIIGSGFGGSVAALRAAEKRYRVGVMESGKRWKDEDLPKSQWHLPSPRSSSSTPEWASITDWADELAPHLDQATRMLGAVRYPYLTPEVAVVQGETSYPTERHTYNNLWVIRLDAEGRCAEFAEWWMRHPAPDEPAGLSDPP